MLPVLNLEKSPKGIRIAEIILGVIAIALSAAVIANPDVTTLLYITLLGIALIMIGISRIIVGASAKQVSKGSRAISIGIGVVSIAGGLFALANPIAWQCPSLPALTGSCMTFPESTFAARNSSRLRTGSIIFLKVVLTSATDRCWSSRWRESHWASMSRSTRLERFASPGLRSRATISINSSWWSTAASTRKSILERSTATTAPNSILRSA